MRKFWSEQEIDVLKKMSMAQKTVSEMSEVLGRTIPAVRCQLDNQGLMRKLTGDGFSLEAYKRIMGEDYGTNRG